MMISSLDRKLRLLGLAVLIWLPFNMAHGQLSQNLVIDSKSVSLGNAVTADPPGLASIHYNPAGLAKLKGRQLEIGLMNIVFNFQTDFYAPEGYNVFNIDGVENDPIFDGDTVARSKTTNLAIYIPGYGLQRLPNGPGVLPTAGFSINSPGSKLTFGNLVYGPDVVGYYRKQNDPGRYLGKTLALQRFTYLSPSVGYEINDEWSVGAGIMLSHQALALDTYLRAPNILVGFAEEVQNAFDCEAGGVALGPFLNVCGGNIGPWDDIGGLSVQVQETISPKFHVGVLWEPTDWFAWGASYQSESDMQMKGTYELRYTDDWAGFWQGFNGSVIGAITSGIFSLPSGIPREAGNLSIDLTHPQHFQTGISVKLNHLLTLNVDVGWTDYSAWDAFLLEFDRDLEFLGAARLLTSNATSNTLRIPLEYEDVWNWGFGLEQHITSRLDLRLGVEFRDSPIQDNRRDSLNPLNDTVRYGAGISYLWDRDTVIDFHASYLRSWEYIPAGTSDNVNSTDIQNIAYNPYAGTDVETTLKVITFGFNFRTKF